jgi:hypothetical protein
MPIIEYLIAVHIGSIGRIGANHGMHSRKRQEGVRANLPTRNGQSKANGR